MVCFPKSENILSSVFKKRLMWCFLIFDNSHFINHFLINYTMHTFILHNIFAYFYGIFVDNCMVGAYQGAHTKFYGLVLSVVTSYMGLIIGLFKEIQHFKMSKNRSLLATIWGQYLARPHKEIWKGLEIVVGGYHSKLPFCRVRLKTITRVWWASHPPVLPREGIRPAEGWTQDTSTSTMFYSLVLFKLWLLPPLLDWLY